MFGFNISGDYSGGFIIANCTGKKCTAPCLQGVSKEFILIGCVLRKRSVFILYFTHPHLFNENKLRTHTLQARCGTFTLLWFPRYFHVTPFLFSMRINSVLTQARCGTFLFSAICNWKSTWVVRENASTVSLTNTSPALLPAPTPHKSQNSDLNLLSHGDFLVQKSSAFWSIFSYFNPWFVLLSHWLLVSLYRNKSIKHHEDY